MLVIFLWQYNFVPLYVNSKIITAEILVNNNKCNQGFSVADDALKNHTFLDAYIRLQYVSFLKTCSGFNPANDTAYAKKGISLLTEATQIQPLYSRAWLFLGSFTNILANKETNTATKQILITEAYQYLNQASKLAPRHQEITITQAQIAQTAKDYIAMKNYSNACVALNPNIGACYFNLALSEIYLKNTAEAEKDMQTAIDKGYNINSKTSLNQLSDAYSFLADWKDLAPVYEKLTEINPNNTQYHSTLAFIYAKLGQYDKARQEANTVLRLSPESKPNVDAFLKTLP